MKKYKWMQFLLMVLAMSSQLTYANQCAMPDLPESITMTEWFFALGANFDISSNLGKHGNITQKFDLLNRPTFTYQNERGEKIATARQTFLSSNLSSITEVSIFDCNDQKIGTVKKHFWKALIGINTYYSIYDKNGIELATSEKLSGFSTQFSIRDVHSKREVVSIERPAFKSWFAHTWIIKAFDRSSIDMRLLMMVGALKSSRDHIKTQQAFIKILDILGKKQDIAKTQKPLPQPSSDDLGQIEYNYQNPPAENPAYRNPENPPAYNPAYQNPENPPAYNPAYTESESSESPPSYDDIDPPPYTP